MGRRASGRRAPRGVPTRAARRCVPHGPRWSAAAAAVAAGCGRRGRAVCGAGAGAAAPSARDARPAAASGGRGRGSGGGCRGAVGGTGAAGAGADAAGSRCRRARRGGGHRWDQDAGTRSSRIRTGHARRRAGAADRTVSTWLTLHMLRHLDTPVTDATSPDGIPPRGDSPARGPGSSWDPGAPLTRPRRYLSHCPRTGRSPMLPGSSSAGTAHATTSSGSRHRSPGPRRDLAVRSLVVLAEVSRTGDADHAVPLRQVHQGHAHRGPCRWRAPGRRGSG